MGTFGKYLAEIGAISREQLDEATDSLVVTGGRLGTNLLELGHLGIEELDRHLAAYLGAPAPPPKWLERPSPEALQALPAALVERHMVLPLAVEKPILHLAMAVPGQPDAMDEIRFATGLQLEPYALCEVHLALLRERHLGIALEGRFAHFSLDWARRHARRGRASGGVTPAATPEAEEAQRQREAFGVIPLERGEELTDERAFSSLHADWLRATPLSEAGEPAAALAPRGEPAACEPEVGPLEPAAVARLEEQLAAATDREDVVRLALRLVCAHAAASALFVIHQGTIRGVAALGPDIPQRVEGILLPLEAESVLCQTARRGVPFRGAPPTQPIDTQLFRALGRQGAREAMVLPIRLGERVVNLLYADNGEHAMGTSSAAAIMALSDCITRAYAGIIRARRRSHC